MAQFEGRREADEALIETAQELMPVSDYAILVPVVDEPTGYHYCVIDPLMPDGDEPSEI